ncbi:hypothetical protein AB1Y20_021632 [Prymnesium parvum]|uniref:EamA domain-containing protein n=1 Tax=Prymnesium parvum TaxID=97485 RepID=A0AB34JM50_PRYPA
MRVIDYVSAFALLTLTSVTMTLGNKWLMMQPHLRTHTQVIVASQNLIAVCATAIGNLLGIVRISPVTSRQLQFYSWDAFVLAIQLWTSFKALRFLSVSATTVCRSLAIPIVAWLELVVIGTRIDARRHVCGWLVVAGAFIYAYDDIFHVSAPAEGYLWALANLLAFCSNSVLDKIFMSSLDQTASGMAMITQLISLPISLAGTAFFEPPKSSEPISEWILLLEWHAAVALFLTGALAAALGRAYAHCYKVASATAVTVAGHINKMISILLSALLFGASVTWPQIVGMTLCLGAAFAFSLTGMRANNSKMKE